MGVKQAYLGRSMKFILQVINNIRKDFKFDCIPWKIPRNYHNDLFHFSMFKIHFVIFFSILSFFSPFFSQMFEFFTSNFYSFLTISFVSTTSQKCVFCKFIGLISTNLACLEDK